MQQANAAERQVRCRPGHRVGNSLAGTVDLGIRRRIQRTPVCGVEYDASVPAADADVAVAVELADAAAVEIAIRVETRAELVRDQRAACVEYRADRRLPLVIGIRHPFERVVRHRGARRARGLTGGKRRSDVGVGCVGV